MSLRSPLTDPTPLFELFRGIHATELLTAAVFDFRVFERLKNRSLSASDLRSELELEERPFVVLLTALRAMWLIQTNSVGLFALTDLAEEHLLSNGEFDVSGYIGLAAQNPSVRGMVERLRTNRPYGSEPKSESGTAFIFRDGTSSAMEQEATARSLTLSLAGRAKNVAPSFAKNMPLRGDATLLDLGGGSGIYSFAWLAENPQARAFVLDRPEVLKVTAEMATDWGVSDRVSLIPGDMFHSDLPIVDAVLLSNVLHDWDVPECQSLIQKSAAALKPQGQVVIHDVFLNDGLDGPLAIALYSASLFSLTEGRAYSAAEYKQWLRNAGLVPHEVIPTMIHCGILSGTKF